MSKDNVLPDYIFEASWEVCNKVGGIYTVLSTRAKTLQDMMPDHIFFVGPDFWQEKENPLFVEDKKLFTLWRERAATENLAVRVGRWQVPGKPIAFLVDFRPFFAYKNDIYGALWRDFQVDSLHAYGDYDEASMFSYAAARVVESFYHYLDDCRLKNGESQTQSSIISHQTSFKVIYQAHEWMTGLGALYLQKHVPQIASIFTTHATTIGRSIAGNGKPLYQYLFAYNGNQMAGELNVESKHSIERQTAHHADCFTTVSDVTARECMELLDKQPDEVLPNGFEMDFVPQGRKFALARNKARRRILDVANALMGTEMTDDTLIISTSGRYEWKNKGIDVYLEGMDRLRQRAEELKRPVLALVEVPAWQTGPREDLKLKIESLKLKIDGSSLARSTSEESVSNEADTPHSSQLSTPASQLSTFNFQLSTPYITHVLHEPWNDPVTATLRAKGFENRTEDRVKVMFVPCYLDGQDGIFNLHYYDLLIGLDMTVYPSYYEPWGYTPLESVAFHVPCLTTTLAGFGLWAEEQKELSNREMADRPLDPKGRLTHPETVKSLCHLDTDGVEVIARTDYNFDEVADRIASEVIGFAALKKKQVETAREAAAALAEKAQWKHFIQYYLRAYDIALRSAAERNSR